MDKNVVGEFVAQWDRGYAQQVGGQKDYEGLDSTVGEDANTLAFCDAELGESRSEAISMISELSVRRRQKRTPFVLCPPADCNVRKPYGRRACRSFGSSDLLRSGSSFTCPFQSVVFVHVIHVSIRIGCSASAL